MGVVDEGAGQESVQQRLDRGVGRAGIQKIGALNLNHLLVGQFFARAQRQQGRQAHRRQARRLDSFEIPAAALDAEHVDILAEEIAGAQLDRGIAATMQHQSGLLAQQPRAVDAQRQLGRDALLGVAPHEARRFVVAPAALHQCSEAFLRKLARSAERRLIGNTLPSR